MIEHTKVFDQQFPMLNDAELDALVAVIPEPSVESCKRYNEKIVMLLEINKEVGVFQYVVMEASPEENAIANNGKYMDASYSFGSVAHKSDRS